MARRSFVTRLLVAILGVAAAAMVAVFAFAFFELDELTRTARSVTAELGATASDYSRTALKDQARTHLVREASLQAQLYDALLERVQDDVTGMAQFLERVYADPGEPATVDPPPAHAEGPLVQLDLAPGVVRTPELEAEIGRIAHAPLFFGNVMAVTPSINAVYAGTETGIMLRYMDLVPLDPGYDPRERPWYPLGAQADGVAWTDIYVDAFTGGLTITAARAFHGPDGGLAGVVGADILLEDLLADLESLRVGSSGHALLIDADGAFIAHTLYSARDLGEGRIQRAYAPALARMAAGETGQVRVSVGGAAYYVAFAPLPATGWSLGMATSEGEILHVVAEMEEDISHQAQRLDDTLEARRGRMVRQFTVVAVVALVLLALVAGYLARSITRPIVRLSRQVAEVGGGNLDAKIDVDGTDEIGRLAAGFNTMTDDLKDHIAHLTAATAEQARIGTDLRIAAQMQHDLLPRLEPPFAPRDDVDLAALMQPATEVGGDLYDFFFADEEQTRLAFAVADVSGKGVSAALFMVTAKTLVKSNKDLGPAELFATVNDLLAQDNTAAMFLTAFFGVLDLRTGVLTWASAGHNPPLLLRAGGDVEILAVPKAPPVGVFPGRIWGEQAMRLRAGDALLLYTDGVTEALNSRDAQYGIERLVSTVTRLAVEQALPADGVVDGLLRDVHDFAAGTPQSDDITMLFCRWLGPA